MALNILSKKTLRSVIRIIFKYLFRIKVHGNPKLLHDDQYCSSTIVTANHTSYLDGLLIAIISDKYMYFAVEKKFALQTRSTRLLFDFMNWLEFGQVIPLDTSSPFSIRSISSLIKNGKCVMLFPEGAISVDGTPLPEQRGLSWLLSSTKAQRFNINISGAEKSKLFGKKGNQFWPKITILYPN